jgi:hypothetical protein
LVILAEAAAPVGQPILAAAGFQPALDRRKRLPKPGKARQWSF